MHNRHIIKSYSQLQASTLFIVPINRHLKIKIKYVLIKYGLCIRSNQHFINLYKELQPQ